ncbi:MAG TPA: prolyl oligopeptidase family serine peptidase [Casimicrobiaceae bacterium]|nr:prolyl oligopeptidase family serine peptidase [Casimicrobiaceae bacterium]
MRAFAMLFPAFLATASAFAATSPATPSAAPPSVETFFRRPAYGGMTLSPNGRYVAVMAPVGERQGLIVVDLGTKAATKMKSPGDGDVLGAVWQNDERLVVRIGELQRASGEPPHESGLVAINRDGSDSRVIAGIEAPRSVGSHIAEKRFERPWFVRLLRVVEGTNDVLLTARERNERTSDVYRYDTVTGEKKLLTFDSPGAVQDWVVDFDGVPRAAVTASIDDDTSAWYVRKTADAPWTKVEEAKLGALDSFPLQFDPDGKLLYVSARRNGDDRASIYEYSVVDNAWRKAIVSHPLRDVDAGNATFRVDYKARKLLGLRYTDDKPSVAWFDAEWARVQKAIDAALPDTVNLLQRRGDRFVVVAYSDRDPGEAYLLDATTMRLEKLLVYEPWIDPKTMAPEKWVRYPARDGLTIPALLTLPPNAQSTRVPLVVVIHGGPNVEATPWGYVAETQFLASRGYAVLQPQFRGTLGFGWKLRSSGFRKWGDEMQDDLEDGVKWAVAQGFAEPDRVCFYGASYGGYAASWGAIKNAKLIKCAVSYVGVTSIDYLFDNAQTDLSRLADRSTLMVREIGDPKTERARFHRVNPLDNADKVGVPILLAYGASDRRVPLAHGTDFRAALDRAGKPYEWVVYADEGHGFNKDENLFDFYGRVDRFLAKYLAPASAAAAAAK